MKRMKLIIFTAVLLLSQIGMLDHTYSEHHSGEVCDYCISSPSLGGALTNTAQVYTSFIATQQHTDLLQTPYSVKRYSSYTSRAPPRLT